MASILDYFPMQQIRPKQQRALEFIDQMLREGYRDIVLAAPTGSGKSAIGVAICNWADSADADEVLRRGAPGGFYAVTQKMLQDQLERDIARYRLGHNHAVSLKTSAEYKCPAHGNCATGRMFGKERGCRDIECTYRAQKRQFLSSAVGITNYPYLFTERTYQGQLKSRRVLVADECHTLEAQIMRFVDLSVSEKLLSEYAPTLAGKNLPKLANMREFARWLRKVYLPAVNERVETLTMSVENGGTGDKLMKLAIDTENHMRKISHGLDTFERGETRWVFWPEEDREQRRSYIARPVEAWPFAPDLVGTAATARIYMSAFPGVKGVFCRSLGLKESEVAWIGLTTTFPDENRRVRIVPVGSLSRENKDRGLPNVLRAVLKLADKHAGEKGLIHCHSYELGEAIYNVLAHSPHRPRLLFPRAGDERDKIYQTHRESKDPTIIISPSMTEGYDFADAAARWQIIAKIPYAYLGDKQVMARKEIDADWYLLETVKTIIQAAGRIVRSDTDYGVTYILDSDFLRLWSRAKEMFPRWFTRAVVMPG